MQQLIDKQNQEISSNVYTTTRTLLIGNNGEDTFVKCNIEIDLKNLKIKVTPTKQIPGVDFLKVFKEQTAIALEVGGNEYLVFLKKTSEGSLQLTWRDKNLNKEEIEKFMQEKDETIAKIIMNGRDLDPWVLTITYEQENREFKAKPRFREEEEEEENQLERGEENWFKAKPRFREEEEEEENQLERGEEKESLPKTKENIEKKEEREKRYEQFFKFYELDWLKEENKEL
ncbi:MAG: hypothetical protein N3D10_04015, partial [Candidatus Micrarchaeota archaeon]|nr:hypothetical protein [Candidatus Micrarchaeota archaeon]